MTSRDLREQRFKDNIPYSLAAFFAFQFYWILTGKAAWMPLITLCYGVGMIFAYLMTKIK